MAYTFTTEQQQLLASVPNNRTKAVLRQIFEEMDLGYLDWHKYTMEYFRSNPIVCKKAGLGAATGTAGDENLCLMERNLFEYHILGTQTIVAPTATTVGLNISHDAANNDGVEYSQGILSNARMAFTVGTHAFFARCKFTIADVTDTDDCAFGFRKAEDYQANIDDYDAMACFNIQAGVVNIETIDDGAGTVTTDTTETDWDDTESHEVEIHVDIDGAVSFLYDGEEPATTKVFSFSDAEVVVPFFFLLHADNSTAGVVLQEWEVGEE